jgi:hypothetical protein
VGLAENICPSATLAKPQAAWQPCDNNLLEEAPAAVRDFGVRRGYR